MSIYEKLSAVQAQLKAPKNQRNTFGGYNYRSCEDILEAVKPLLKENGLVLLMSDYVEEIGGWHYVRAWAELYEIETGDKVGVNAFAREEETKKGMDAAQITGAASSYARKYALNGLFDIDDSKIEASPDPDTQPRKQEKSKEKSEATKPHWICADCGNEITDVMVGNNKYKAETIISTSQRRHGLNLCATCLTARRANGNEGS